MSTHKINISRDVRFYETIFPYLENLADFSTLTSLDNQTQANTNILLFIPLNNHDDENTETIPEHVETEYTTIKPESSSNAHDQLVEPNQITPENIQNVQVQHERNTSKFHSRTSTRTKKPLGWLVFVFNVNVPLVLL